MARCTRWGVLLSALVVALVAGGLGLVPPARGAEPVVVHRVNAGGPALAGGTGSPGWGEDSATSPSPDANTAEAGNATYATTGAIDLSHPSVPAGTPAALFQTERWDPAAPPELTWSFPVSAGSHQVRLYLAEVYSGAFTAGSRVFDVTIEGGLVLDDYDVFAEVGANKGVVKSFTVTSDATLTIQFGHVVENPSVKGIEILASPAPPPAALRVNAGGPALAGGAGSPTWAEDSFTSPSPYANTADAGNSTYTTGASIDLSHPSVPVGTPAALFQTERWDAAAPPELTWSFPVTPGRHEVRLYFAEIYDGAFVAGKRVFDVSIEGAVLLDDYDVFAEVGANKGVVKAFTVTADATLTIQFGHVVENPSVKGIEILAASAGPNQLGAFPTSVGFGTVAGGSTATRTVELTNLGSSGDPSVVVGATAISGPDAAQFGDSFDDATDVTLGPGASTTVKVTFAPAGVGSRSATLMVTHSGSNSPLSVALAGTGGSAVPISFGKSTVAGTSLERVTSLQFGPDGRLYMAEQDGLVRAVTVARNGPNSYSVTATETIGLVRTIPNHDDDGSLNPSVTTRMVTGILVTGTAATPVVYVTSSDPRIGGGTSGFDTDLDTNSGVISRLTRSGSGWQKVDLVRGLPRSEENHAANGMALDPGTNTLFVAQGGNTNKGAPSFNFARLPEFALSTAILAVDLGAIGDTTYDLPTLDDENRPGTPDAGDPFGGNNGKNQARLVAGGPVRVHAPGFRNPYDVVLTSGGRMYTVDNGGNAGWGDVPVGEGPAGTCTNQVNDAGTTEPDTLHLVAGPGYYGGHPNPTRGNKANTFNANGQSPVAAANPVECDHRAAGPERGNLTSFPTSTNGLAEYTASNFGGAMKGDLLAADWDNSVWRVKLDGTGSGLVLRERLFSNVATLPLDVTALGDAGPFPGTVWAGDYVTGAIVVFEPADFGGSGPPPCSGADDAALDEDGDGYSNADEVDNGTDPCSAADVPPDWDKDKVSDLNDPDDDNDGRADVGDPFAVDPANGTTTPASFRYTWDNDTTGPGGLLGLGFTGLMGDGVTDYKAMFDPSRMTAGGAAGVVTVDAVPDGDALGPSNTQRYGFQVGVDASPSATGPFTVRTRIGTPFGGLDPKDHQSMGAYVGTGTQDDYVKVVTAANGGGGGVQVVTEVGGSAAAVATVPLALPGPNAVDLHLTVDPAAATVQAAYAVVTDGVSGPLQAVGGVQAVPSSWFGAGLAVGIISTSAGPAPEFPATWDLLEAVPVGPSAGTWQRRAPSGAARQEVSYVHAPATGKLYLAGASSVHEAYDPATNTWSQVAPLPQQRDHVQGVELNGRIYYIGGLTGWPGPATGRVDVYDPAANTFTTGAPMPAGRERGAGGVAVYGGRIYYAGGLHGGSAVPWFDVYDPVAKTWSALPDMPRARDHFHAAVVGSRLFAIGGRATSIGATIAANDAFDLVAGTWATGLKPLPTPRGGFAAAVLGTEVLVIGGEVGNGTKDTVEAYDTAADSWRSLAPMPTARHGIQAAVCNGGVYVAAGGTTPGGSNPTTVHEVLFLGAPAPCPSSSPPPPPPPPPATVAQDAFGRSVSGGWGTAPTGGAWARVSGSTSNFSVDGSRGAIRAPANGSQQVIHLPGTSVRDADAAVTVAFPTMPAAGGNHLADLVLRRQSGGAHYRVGLRLDGSGVVRIRGETQAGGSLFAAADTGLRFAAGDSYRVRVQVEGASPTTIRAKAWKVGVSEPPGWTVTATDATSGLQVAGSVGVRVVNNTPQGSAATLRFDDLAVLRR